MTRRIYVFSYILIAMLFTGCGATQASGAYESSVTGTEAVEEFGAAYKEGGEPETEEKIEKTTSEDSESEDVAKPEPSGTESENPTEVESVEIKENKRPVSVVAKDQTGESEIEYFDDGSWCITVPFREDDYHIYFFKNGAIHRIERYEFSADHPEGELKEISYYFFGIPTRSQAYLRQFATIGGLDDLIPEYDSEGNIINEDYISSGNNQNIPQRKIDPEGYIVERDGQGRISKIYENEEEAGISGIRQYDISYQDNTVQIMEYRTWPDQYDATARSVGKSKFEDGVGIIYNDDKQPIELHHLDADGNIREDLITNFEYDQYGFLMSIVNRGQTVSSFEYTY